MLLPQDTVFQDDLDKPELDFGAEIIAALPRDIAATYLAGMSSDMAADLVQLLDEPVRADLMSGSMPPPAPNRRAAGARRTQPAR